MRSLMFAAVCTMVLCAAACGPLDDPAEQETTSCAVTSDGTSSCRAPFATADKVKRKYRIRYITPEGEELCYCSITHKDLDGDGCFDPEWNGLFNSETLNTVTNCEWGDKRHIEDYYELTGCEEPVPDIFCD